MSIEDEMKDRDRWRRMGKLYQKAHPEENPDVIYGTLESNEFKPSKVLSQDQVDAILRMPDNPTNPSHYSRWKIEPIDFISANNLDFLRGNIIKYIMRYDAKGGLEDLKKARVYLDKLIEKVERNNGMENN